MASKELRVLGALLAVCLMVAGAQADDAGQIAALESSKSVFLPTTPNDFSGMIYSLLQEQSSRIANKDGAQDESNPVSLLAAMAGWAQQAQTALFNLGDPVNADGSAVTSSEKASFQAKATPAQPDPLGTLLNQSTTYANIIAGAHPDPIPNNLVNLLVENPLGPQLDAAFKALPSLQDPIGKQNTTAFFGSAFTKAAAGIPPYFKLGGANVPINQGAAVLSYRPCFVSQSATGISVSTQLIVVNPRGYTSTLGGIAVTPKLIEVQPAIIKIKPVGLNVSPTGIQVYPRLINIGPQVTVSYPATPPPATKKAAASTPKPAASGK